MAAAGILSAAAGLLPGGTAVSKGISVVSSGGSALNGIVSVVDPGKARDEARVHRRDFFLNAAKAGSVLAARYLINGEANVYTVKEKGEYKDGVKELASGNGLWQQTLANARAAGPLWDDKVGAGDLTEVGVRIANELGQDLNVPADVQNVNQKTLIESWAQQFGYKIRADVSQGIAQAAAGVGSGVASAVAPPGSDARNTVLVPTTKNTLVVVAIVIVLALGYFFLRKR